MVQALANGLVDGLQLAVVAVAFSAVFSSTRIFFIALGAIYMFAPYWFKALQALHFPWIIAVFSTVTFCSLISVACELMIHYPLERKKGSPEVHFIASLGTFLALTQMTVILWGPDAQTLPLHLHQTVAVGAVRLTAAQVLEFAGASGLLLVIFVLLSRSNNGLLVRALIDNPLLLSICGRNIRFLRCLIFVLSGVVMGVISLLTALDIGFDSTIGMKVVLIGAAATIAGGPGSFVGAATAGFCLGVLRQLVSWGLSNRWEECVTFVVLVVALLISPRGLGRIFQTVARVEETE